MGKRLAIITVILLLVALAIMGYYIQQGRKKYLTDPYKAVSPSAAFVIETTDIKGFLNSLTSGKGLFGEAARIKELEGFSLKLKVFADQLNKPAYARVLEGSTVLMAFYPEGDGRLSGVLSMNVAGDLRLRHLKDILHSSGIRNTGETRSGGTRFLIIPYDTGTQKDTVWLTLNSGLLLCSAKRTMVTGALLRMSGTEDVREMPGFERVHMASGKNQDRIFVLFPNLLQLTRGLLSPAGEAMAERIAGLAGTAGGDIYINDKGLILSGYTESTDSSEYLFRFKNIQPAGLQTYKFLPAATILFETLVVPGDLKGTAVPDTIAGSVVELANKLRLYTGAEVTKALIDIRDQPLEDNALVVFELSNRAGAEQVFTGGLGPSAETRYFEPDDQVRIPVYKAALGGLTAALKPGFAAPFREGYFAFFDSYMVAGSSEATVSRFLYDNILHKTLANDLAYHDFESSLPSRAGYFVYCIPSRLLGYLSSFLGSEVMAALKGAKPSLDKIESAGYQFAASNGMLYNSLSLRYKEEARQESTTEWETLLDTVAAIKPFFFTNHNTGAREIFIQDLNNYTYLINSAGRVLWKVPLNERITGSVFMIDYYRNGKYQLLFSGKNYLHMLDRNGNYVERYPVRLRSPATSSLAVFDYDNTSSYRLFIAGEDKNIYSYDKTGSVVKGWTPFRTAGFVRSEIAWFRVSGKDFIVVSDDKSVYFLDRQGNKRLTPGEPVTRSAGSTLRLTPGSDPSLVCTSPDGSVQHIYFDGKVKKFRMNDFTSQHSFDYFDINGDGFGEYIFIDKGVLYLYNRNREEIFHRDFGSDDLGGPINFIFSASDRKIGVFDATKKLIYLIDKGGKTTEGFPLRGASMFSIGKLSEKSGWHLIVGGTDRFLYNYRIETGN